MERSEALGGGTGLLSSGGLCGRIRWLRLTSPNSGVGVPARFIQALVFVLDTFLSCDLFSLPLPHLHSNQPSLLSTTLFFCDPKAVSITFSPLVITLYFLCVEKTHHPLPLPRVWLLRCPCQTSSSPCPSPSHSPARLQICIFIEGSLLGAIVCCLLTP